MWWGTWIGPFTEAVSPGGWGEGRAFQWALTEAVSPGGWGEGLPVVSPGGWGVGLPVGPH